MIEGIFGVKCAKCGARMGGFLSVFTGRWRSITHPTWCKDCFWFNVPCSVSASS